MRARTDRAPKNKNEEKEWWMDHDHAPEFEIKRDDKSDDTQNIGIGLLHGWTSRVWQIDCC